jgi:ubiquinone/menaquinone biosynthesis C-methylase UbiE
VFPDGSVLVEPGPRELAARCFPERGLAGNEKEKNDMTSNDQRLSPGAEEISYPRFAAFYNRMMKLPQARQQFDPLRREIVEQAHGVVLEVGAGGGQNFPFYDRSRVVSVEAIEPDKTMLVYAEGNQGDAPVPITLTRASVEMLPFPDAHFDSVVVTLVLCSVHDPEHSLREIRRVLSPGGSLLLLEHVRAQGKMAAKVQDALVPLTTRYLGNCHWDRDTGRLLTESGFEIVSRRMLGGGLQPFLIVHARRTEEPGER